MKLKIFRVKNELADLRSRIDSINESYKARMDRLESELFEFKHPNGVIYFCFHYFGGYHYACFKYAYLGSIKTTEIDTCHVNMDSMEHIASKSIIKGKYAYIGLRFDDGELTERYFIVDMSDGKSIECTNQDIMNTVEWVSLIGA